MPLGASASIFVSMVKFYTVAINTLQNGPGRQRASWDRSRPAGERGRTKT
jgi:hypothetical protein